MPAFGYILYKPFLLVLANIYDFDKEILRVSISNKTEDGRQ